MVLDRAGRLTPPGLRAAIARAVMEVNPAKARKRREHAAKQARVQRWAEPSGNAGLTGRELPPAEVLAADQRITWWATQLRDAGAEGGMDLLRARAFLDILLGTDSRPAPAARDASSSQDAGLGQDTNPGQDAGLGQDTNPGQGVGLGQGRPAGPGSAETRKPAAPGPLAGAIPPGFIGRGHLTVPLVSLLGLADRPGEMPGLGPVDPDLARTLAAAAARNPKTTWCVTITDSRGRPIGHGCARPGPTTRTGPTTRNGHAARHGSARIGPGPPDPPGPSQSPASPGPPVSMPFRFTPSGRGPSGGYGTWTLSVPGRPDLQVTLESLSTDPCDHRHQARGHDPGVTLRHLTEILHATCTAPGCRRPAARCDYEHNTPYESGGQTCLCNGNPTCRHDHRAKQLPTWNVEQLGNGDVRWTMPSGRKYVTGPTRYPI
jgi:hypothetical protein